MTLKQATTTILKRQPRMAEVPHERATAKVNATFLGLGIAVFGMFLTGGGLWLLVKVQPFTVWLLSVPGAGIVLVLVGGIVISKDVAVALLEAVGIARKAARAVQGKNGNGSGEHQPPPAEAA